jgi:hypothetical protein
MGIALNLWTRDLPEVFPQGLPKKHSVSSGGLRSPCRTGVLRLLWWWPGRYRGVRRGVSLYVFEHDAEMTKILKGLV